MEEERISTTRFRLQYIRNRRFEYRIFHHLPGIICLIDFLLISRRKCRRDRCYRCKRRFHNPETGLCVLVFRNHCHPIARTQVFIWGIMATTTSYPEISRCPTCRIVLLARQIRAIPIQAPLFHIPVHVTKSECIRWCLSYLQRDRFQIAGCLLILPICFRQTVTRII